MKNRKSVKAILFSAVTLLVCMAMFVGSTFAWFTDSAKSKNQVIKAGNLDMIVTASSNGAAGSYLPVENVTLFNPEALWEPGYAEVAYVNIENNGTLAFEYSVEFDIISETGSTNVNGDDFKLSQYIRYSVIDTDTVFASREDAIEKAEEVAGGSRLVEDGFFVDGNIDRDQNVLYPAGSTGASKNHYAIVLFMPTSVGNEANYDANLVKAGLAAIPSVEFGLKFEATQVDYEEDDFDDQYDVDATYPEVVTTADELEAAVAAGYSIVNVTDDITLNEIVSMPASGTLTINGNGQTITAPASGNRLVNVTGATSEYTLNLNGVKLDAEDKERGISFVSNNNKPINVNIDNCEVDAGKYGIKVNKECDDTTILVTNSTVKGWSAYEAYAKVDLTFKNCNLIGVNTYSGATDTYSVIMFTNDKQNGASSKGSSLTLEGCKVYAVKAGGAEQLHIIASYEYKDTYTFNFVDTEFYYGTQADLSDARLCEAKIAYGQQNSPEAYFYYDALVDAKGNPYNF